MEKVLPVSVCVSVYSRKTDMYRHYTGKFLCEAEPWSPAFNYIIIDIMNIEEVMMYNMG